MDYNMDSFPPKINWESWTTDVISHGIQKNEVKASSSPQIHHRNGVTVAVADRDNA